MARKEALAGIPPPMEPPHNHNFRCVQASARRRIPRATSIQHRDRTYRRHPPFIYQPQAGGSGVGALIAMAVIAALEKAAPNYMPLARYAIDRLQLSDRDLSWVHPDYEQEFKRSLNS